MARRTDDAEAIGAQRSIQSIEVGFRLIHALENSASSLPLKTLAARAEMTPAKAHLYLVSFIRLGLVVQDPLTSRYGLGPYALRLGQAALGQLELPAVAREHLEKLQVDFELPTYLAIWGEGGPFSILKFDADLRTPVTIKVGFVFPLLGTATGRIFLSYLPERMTRQLVDREAALDPELAAREKEIVRDVRMNGISISEGYLFRGFSALSAPVFDHAGQLAAAVSMIGIGSKVDRNPEGSMALAVMETGRAISRALGYAAGERSPRAGEGLLLQRR